MWLQERTRTLREQSASTLQNAEYYEREIKLLDVLADGLLLLDADHRIMRVNSALERLIEQPAHRLIGRPAGQLLRDADTFVTRLFEAQKVVRDVPLELCTADRTMLPVSVSGAIAPRPSQTPEAVLLVRDLRKTRALIKKATEAEVLARTHHQLQESHKNLKEAQTKLMHSSKLAAIGQLAAGVAHEVNNPAAFIMSNLHFLKQQMEVLSDLAGQAEPQLAKRMQDVLTDMEEATEDNLKGIDRIHRITSSLRTFSRIDQDERALIQVDELIEEACMMAYNEIKHRAELVRRLNAPPKLLADRGKLTQVITNLLINAAHSIGPGSKADNQIRVESRLNGQEIRIVVEDTGSGIPEELRRKIFDPFFTTKTRGLGTGLGLSLSAEIIRQHGGQIDLHSSVGHGSKFTIRLPIVNEPISAPRVSLETASPVHRARLLIIDDERPLLEAYKRLLRATHEVVCADNGQAGIELIAQGHSFDVIVCDLMMPKVDGMNVHAFVKSKCPELLGRMLFATGGAFTPEAKAFLNSPGIKCIEKPFTPDELKAAIAELFQESSTVSP